MVGNRVQQGDPTPKVRVCALCAEHASGPSVTTCVIADHWLGAAYVFELLKCDESIALINFDHVVECSDCQQCAPVFIIDYGGLRLPFSQCLIALRRNFPSARYLVVGHDRSPEDVMRIVQLGVDGFMPYRHVAGELVRAVHAIASGQIWVDSPTLTRLIRARGRGLISVDQAVTFRESQILELAKSRLTNKEIGAVLGIQESTVKYHLTNIFAKLRVCCRDDLLDNPDPTGCWRRLLQVAQSSPAQAKASVKYGHIVCEGDHKTGT